VTQVEWYLRNTSDGSLRARFFPPTNSTLAFHRFINPCSYQEAYVTVPSQGLVARGDYSIDFTIASTSISGDATVSVGVDITARADAGYSRVVTLPSPALANETVEVRLMIRDEDDLEVRHSDGQDAVSVTMVRSGNGLSAVTAQCTTPSLGKVADNAPTFYTAECSIPRDSGRRLQAGTFYLTVLANQQPAGGGGPLSVNVVCPGNLRLSGSGSCICDLGSYLSDALGRCVACPPGTFKDSLETDGCRLCADVRPGSITAPGVTGAKAPLECVCQPGRYLDNG
jgi:hypothetical protein